MKTYKAPHEPYAWGETHTTKPGKLSRNESLSDEAQAHQAGIVEYRSIPHPNVAAEMEAMGSNSDLEELHVACS